MGWGRRRGLWGHNQFSQNSSECLFNLPQFILRPSRVGVQAVDNLCQRDDRCGRMAAGVESQLDKIADFSISVAVAFCRRSHLQ